MNNCKTSLRKQRKFSHLLLIYSHLMGVEHQILTEHYICTAAEPATDNADGKRNCKLYLPGAEFALGLMIIESLDGFKSR